MQNVSVSKNNLNCFITFGSSACIVSLFGHIQLPGPPTQILKSECQFLNYINTFHSGKKLEILT